MSCLPESGGCERHRTDPFVDHLNKARRTTYSHKSCLDRLYRNSPQPEALYIDQTGRELVIERKSIVWPADYAARHRNDHLIAEFIAENLHEIASGRPLSVQLEPATLMPRDRLLIFAREITATIRASIASIDAGRTIGSSAAGRSWSCALDAAERAANEEPATGLIVRWVSRDDLISPDQIPAALAQTVAHAFSDTVNKFSGYPTAAGILLLDPYGSIRYAGNWWWAEVFTSVPVPGQIAEVWLSMYDWVTDTEQGWMFEQVHPTETRSDNSSKPNPLLGSA